MDITAFLVTRDNLMDKFKVVPVPYMSYDHKYEIKYNLDLGRSQEAFKYLIEHGNQGRFVI